MTAQTVPEEAEMAEISSLVTSEVHGNPVKTISRNSKMLVPFAHIIGAFQMLTAHFKIWCRSTCHFRTRLKLHVIIF